jgi:hypothetical protein
LTVVKSIAVTFSVQTPFLESTQGPPPEYIRKRQFLLNVSH